MESPASYRTSLRIPAAVAKRIERECRRDGDRLSLSQWVARAIAEKIARYDAITENAVPAPDAGRYSYLEFFAGGGMARAGLGVAWDCRFANDISPMKARVYRDNWGAGDELVVADIRAIRPAQIAGRADLAWASFPCQDLSLAGNRKGLGEQAAVSETRSGAFWPFWQVLLGLAREQRAPRLVVLENVAGALTSNAGKDFAAVANALCDANYVFGAVMVDARHFVPQSRPRLFIIAVRGDVPVPPSLSRLAPTREWHPARLLQAFAALHRTARDRWVWWNLPAAPENSCRLVDLIEAEPTSTKWHTPLETQRILGRMSDLNLAKLRQVQASKERTVGGVYNRTRMDAGGRRAQRAEVRFDDIAGCLRTPSGGSSRQTLLIVEGDTIRSRLLSAREAARLMGLPDDYILPTNYNDAYHVAGDGVVVPVVRFLAQHLLEPLLADAEPSVQARTELAA